MKKGDDRKQMILETAERLFYEKGYESTSVQDILDELNLSKGGFYHHFESKLALLEAIVEQKCEGGAQAAEQAVWECAGSAVDKLNLLFAKSGLWQNASMDYIGLLLRVSYVQGSFMLREKLKQTTYQRALPIMNEIVRQGVQEGTFHTRYPDEIGSVILLLGACMTDEIAGVLTQPTQTGEELTRILDKLEVYRSSVETLLNAPYGSVILYDMERMVEIFQAISDQNRRLALESMESGTGMTDN